MALMAGVHVAWFWVNAQDGPAILTVLRTGGISPRHKEDV